MPHIRRSVRPDPCRRSQLGSCPTSASESTHFVKSGGQQQGALGVPEEGTYLIQARLRRSGRRHRGITLRLSAGAAIPKAHSEAILKCKWKPLAYRASGPADALQ
jgi:hypothetical protein